MRWRLPAVLLALWLLPLAAVPAVAADGEWVEWRRHLNRSSAAVPSSVGRTGGATLEGVKELAERRMREWLKDGLPVLHVEAPKKPSPPPMPKLVKGEFETLSDFEARVAEAEVNQAEAIRALQRNYEREVAAYNTAAEAHNEAVRIEINRRRLLASLTRQRFLGEAMSEVLGEPELRDVRYDADTQRVHGRVTSSSGRFDKPVTAYRVPPRFAQMMKEQPDVVSPVVAFSLEGQQFVLSSIRIEIIGQPFEAVIDDGRKEPSSRAAAVQAPSAEIPELPKVALISPDADIQTILRENGRAFSDLSTAMKTDPTLESLRRQEEDVAKRMREAEQRRSLEIERDRLRAAIRQQEEKLALLEDGGQPAAARKWNFRPAAKPAADTVAVIIGNRRYGRGIPTVRFAANDARAVRQFVESGLRVPAENILFELDASKGIMEGLFQARLSNLIEKGRTSVIVYYSGHGMAVAEDAYLMPSDARPETAKVTGYSRSELIEQLANLGARDVTLILDACFTGLSAEGPLLADAKPILVQAEAPSIPQNMLLVAASGPEEISWADESVGMSLMTLHLLEALSGAEQGVVDAKSLEAHLAQTVDRHARRVWEQPQHPQVIGANKVLVRY